MTPLLSTCSISRCSAVICPGGGVLDGDTAQRVMQLLRDDAEQTYGHYEEMLDADGIGLARELARMNLTLNTYTQWYWKTDLHNLFHFLSLRADAHAQYEIRVYAEAMLRTVEAWVPLASQAFRDQLVQLRILELSPPLGVRPRIGADGSIGQRRGRLQSVRLVHGGLRRETMSAGAS